jgi:two-component system chemotaxis sensor kinase CheA
VDSKRIDNLLNLVSETVINKATFNQISTQFSDNLLGYADPSLHMKEGMKELFESPCRITWIKFKVRNDS